MKILAVRIKNLASLEGTTSIDFTQEPLASAGIFAITGPTGSGKSTILDAICLALYAETPRYRNAENRIDIKDVPGSTIKQNDVRAILRDGTADGFAEVDFVGIDGQHYRANWSVRRARNRADGGLQQANTMLKNLTAGSDIGGRKSELLPEISRLVGLNYDQFVRSVLLAQGDFTAFLKADKDQKASLLEKLTGTHIYSEISQKIFERHREESQALRLLQNQQEGIRIFTVEELVALKEQEASLVALLNQLDGQLDAARKELKWHEELTINQKQVEDAGRTLTDRLNEKSQSADREVYLKRVERVQSTRSWMDALADTVTQLDQRRKALKERRSRHELLVVRVTAAGNAVVEATQHLDKQLLAMEEAKPLLDQAIKLDVRLQAKQTEVVAARVQLDTRNSKWEDSQQRIVQQQQQAAVFERSILGYHRWQEQHNARQRVAENRILIDTKLTDGCKLLEGIQQAAAQVIRFENEMEAKAAEHSIFMQRSEHLAHQLTLVQQRLETLQNGLSTVSASQLREDSMALTKTLEELLVGASLWQTVCQTQRAYRELYDKWVGDKRELEGKENQFKVAEDAFRIASEQRKASSALLERATIAASANVASLRGQLTDGQPCPVCGSETHPYSHANPQLNHVLDELKRGHDELEASYEQQQAAYVQLAQVIPFLRQSSQEVERALQTEQQQLEQQTADWQACAVSMLCADVAPEGRELWLRNRSQSLVAEQDVISNQLARFEKMQSDTEAIKQSLELLRAEHTAAIHAAKDTEREIHTMRERLVHARAEQTDGEARLGELVNLLGAHFPDDLWVANWKRQPRSFLKNVNDFADEWMKTVEALERDRNQLRVLEATLAGLRIEEMALAKDAKESAQNLKEKEGDYLTIFQSRQSIFGGEAADVAERRFMQYLHEAQEELNSRKLHQENLQTDRAVAEATISETERQVSQLEEYMDVTSAKIDQWLLVFNANQRDSLDRALLQSLLMHDTGWISHEREALAAIERAVTQAESVLEERQRRLEQHEGQRPSDQLPEALNECVATLVQQKAESQREHNEIGFRLRQDETNKRQLGDLLMTIQAQHVVAEDWSKLNDIIGSADGKKFRQVAQEFTLDALLSYANEHLKMLARRYRLQRIPASLGLQVVDRDMGDEVRSVYSLSGGESFLVSLALALGLASLSAKTMQVESLFIDEGFGSLDPDMLNIAMDALERLHSQGRKVGVISHVQEMTERIPVRIAVVKQHSGMSKVVL